MFLDDVFRLRQVEALQGARKRTPQESFTHLTSLNTQQLLRLASSDSAALRELMGAALEADLSLQPRPLPPQDDLLVVTALDWQLQAHRLASKALQTPDAPPPSVSPPPAAVLPPGFGIPSDSRVLLPPSRSQPVCASPSPPSASPL